MKRISYILLAILTLSTPLQALIFVIPSGTTKDTPLTLPDPGDGAIIEKGGSLETAATALIMNDNNQTVLNDGLISTTGNGARGILNSSGDNAVITNSGRISTTGNNSANGIFSNAGNSVVITNSGRISTTGNSFCSGIFNIGGNSVVITNNGRISTTGNNSFGIGSVGNNEVITNSGRISTTGDDSVGINSSGENEVITNNGIISTTGDSAHGIVIDSSINVVITNSGRISTTGDSASGIITPSGEPDSNNVHIINSGTIKSAQAFALDLRIGSNPTLTLLRGSNLQGCVGVDSNFTLNVETGLNLSLTLDSGSFDNLGIKAPFVQVGDLIGVIDPTGLALQADVVADLSDTILNGIYRHRISCCNPCGCGLWAQGIGSYRKRSHDSDIVGYDNWQGGFLLGYDTYLCGGNASLFGGASFAEAEVDQHTQKADINNYFGGVSYERLFCNSFLGLAVAVGYVDWDNERFVMNNLAKGGVEKAHADIDGFFISPEATLAHRFVSLWCAPTMSFTFRYAGLFLGDYTEKGSATNLSVKDREIDLLTTRFEVAIPYSDSWGACCWSVEPYAGVFGRYQVGGYDVDGELLGKSLHFDQGGPKNLAAFLLGFRGIQSFDCFNLFLNLEASFDNEDSTRILGEGGIGWNF